MSLHGHFYKGVYTWCVPLSYLVSPIIGFMPIFCIANIRYLLDRNRGPDSSQNMIRVLSLCPNLSQRYKLSKQLGLPLEGTQFDEDFLKDVSKL